MSGEEATVELARKYFAWIGPATVNELQWFTSMSAKAAKAACEELKLHQVEDNRLLLPAHFSEWESFKIAKNPQYVLVSGIDGLALLRRDIESLFDSNELTRKFLTTDGGKGVTADLPSHGIFDRGQLVGLWEYDPAAQAIAWLSFIPKNKDLENAVKQAEDYVRTQLGDARSFSLDSPKSRVTRIEALRLGSQQSRAPE